jgi:hypothetical protein
MFISIAFKQSPNLLNPYCNSKQFNGCINNSLTIYMKGKGLINYLAKVGFKEAIHDYCFSHQSKSYKDNMEFIFTDSLNRKYFYFPELKNMPLPLLEKLNELQEQLNAKIPGRDLDKWVECIEKTLNGNSLNKVTDAGYWLGVLKDRRSILFDPTLLTEIAALLYICEDENPCFYSKELHKEKFEMLWADSREGTKLYDFFQQAGMKGYIPSGNITPQNWEQYLAESMVKIEAFNSAVMRISTLGLGLEE